MSRRRKITEMKVIERRPTYNSKEEEREALSRGALKLAMIGEKYSKKNSDEQDTA